MTENRGNSIDYLKANKAAWDLRTATHIKSKFYDVEDDYSYLMLKLKGVV